MLNTTYITAGSWLVQKMSQQQEMQVMSRMVEDMSKQQDGARDEMVQETRRASSKQSKRSNELDGPKA